MTDLIRPLFITGLWRSGTTLLSRIIDSFENYSVTYDTLHFMRFIYYELDKISNNTEFKFLIYKNQNRINSRYNLDISFDSVIHKYKFNSNKAKIYDALMRCIYKDTINWGEKSNLESSSIENFLKLFPKGKVIFLIRDPRAVLYSWKKYTNSPKPSYLNSVINSYINLERAKKYMNNENILILKYENLISKPTKEIQNICNFLNVKFSKKYLNLDLLKDINNKKWKINSVHASSKK